MAEFFPMATIVGKAKEQPLERIYFSKKKATSCSVFSVFLGISLQSAVKAEEVTAQAREIYASSFGVFSSRRTFR